MIDWFEVVVGIVTVLAGVLLIKIGYLTELGSAFLFLGGYHLGKRTMDRKGKIVMSEEERKAVELLKNIENNTWSTKYIMSSDSKNARTLINLIETQNKMIELMADYIKDIDDCINSEFNSSEFSDCNVQEIIEYFRNKAKESE